MTANFAPRSRANRASARALRWAVTASTRNRSRCKRTRSMVLVPIEPVAPSSVIDISFARGAASALANGTTDIDITSASPQQQPARRSVRPPAHQSDHCCHAGGSNETVKSVHQPAMPGNHMASILYPEPALDYRFESVSRLPNDRQHDCDACDRQKDRI